MSAAGSFCEGQAVMQGCNECSVVSPGRTTSGAVQPWGSVYPQGSVGSVGAQLYR